MTGEPDARSIRRSLKVKEFALSSLSMWVAERQIVRFDYVRLGR